MNAQSLGIKVHENVWRGDCCWPHCDSYTACTVSSIGIMWVLTGFKRAWCLTASGKPQGTEASHKMSSLLPQPTDWVTQPRVESGLTRRYMCRHRNGMWMAEGRGPWFHHLFLQPEVLSRRNVAASPHTLQGSRRSHCCWLELESGSLLCLGLDPITGIFPNANMDQTQVSLPQLGKYCSSN